MVTRVVPLAVLSACAVGAFACWGSLGTPVPLADAPTDRAACVSYAPFQGTETPFDKAFMIPPDRVERDLKALSSFTSCVRTYATTNGLDAVPAAAEKVGMTVLQGIWIGREDADNALEMQRGVALAQKYPQTVRGVIVGNEALLRREITAERLGVLIDHVKAQVPQPVTYADVWEFWEKNPSLARSVDFITIHLLPYWEDNPSSIETAVAHVGQTHDHMAKVFPDKKLLIGEIGWPSAGRQRQGAEATLVNETRFVREVMAAAEAKGWNYNLIESFDQPWKRALEGTAGGAWGLFTDDRQAKVTLKGPVVEEPLWRQWMMSAAGLSVLLAGAVVVGGAVLDAAGLAVAVSGALASGGALSFLAYHALQSSRTPLEWAANGLIWLLMAVVSVASLRQLRNGELYRPEGKVEEQALLTAALPTLGRLRLASLAVAAASMIGHLADARYRDFPSSMLVVAAVAFVLLRLVQKSSGIPLPVTREERWLAAVTLVGVPWVIFDEGLANGDAVAWALVAGVLAASTWVGRCPCACSCSSQARGPSA